MKWIKKFESFDLSVEGNQEKDLDWVRGLIERTMSVGNWSGNLRIETDSGGIQYLNLGDETHQLHIYDNLRDNDFFFVRIYKEGQMIQNFTRYSREEYGYSPDEIASEDIIIYISRYFQNL